MKFFLPDSQDLVDPSFDFRTETRSEHRLRQRDDLYAHEVFAPPPYDGVLVSKAIVEGRGGAGGRFALAQRHRLFRQGVRSFFRIDTPGKSKLETMGDCGAFSYVREEVPPYSVEEVASFYDDLGFDHGFSVDHVILAFDASADGSLPGFDLVNPEWRRRQEITIELAADFLKVHASRGSRFTPIGVAQGWSPRSYAHSVECLQKMGYRRIALGGMVPLKTPEILMVLKEANSVRRPDVAFHLLGISRCEQVGAFRGYGVTSFDSTSALRQAFKDDKDNYYAMDTTYTAVRVPQVDANPKLVRSISAGEVDQKSAIEHERRCLRLLNEFDRDAAKLEHVLEALDEYDHLVGGKGANSESNRRVLEAKPWKECPCEICRDLGIHVILFRGAERNRRRGFHNVHVFYRRLHRELKLDDEKAVPSPAEATAPEKKVRAKTAKAASAQRPLAGKPKRSRALAEAVREG